MFKERKNEKESFKKKMLRICTKAERQFWPSIAFSQNFLLLLFQPLILPFFHLLFLLFKLHLLFNHGKSFFSLKGEILILFHKFTKSIQGVNIKIDPLPDKFALFQTISPAILKNLIVTIYSLLTKTNLLLTFYVKYF